MCPVRVSGNRLHTFLPNRIGNKMLSEEFVDILKKEFLCYYHVDLLPDSWDDRDTIAQMAYSSARRLKGKIKDQKESLIGLLKELVDDREHPINAVLSDETDVEWHIEEEDWQSYVFLLKNIILNLEK